MFITFEGIDGSGKTTQLNLVYQKLIQNKYQVIQTFEPGATPFGAMLRQQLNKANLAPQSELLCLLLDRSEHISNCIQPALQASKIILCDRYHDSTLAYQIGAKQIQANWLPLWEKENLLIPDITFLFNLPISLAKERMQARNLANEKTKSSVANVALSHFEEDLILLEKVQNYYCKLAKEQPNRFITLDASLSIEELTHIIYTKIKSLLTV